MLVWVGVSDDIGRGLRDGECDVVLKFGVGAVVLAPQLDRAAGLNDVCGRCREPLVKLVSPIRNRGRP